MGREQEVIFERQLFESRIEHRGDEPKLFDGQRHVRVELGDELLVKSLARSLHFVRQLRLC